MCMWTQQSRCCGATRSRSKEPARVSSILSQGWWVNTQTKLLFCINWLIVFFTQTKGSEDKVAETRVSLVKEEKLKETLASLDKVFSQHVFRWLHLECQCIGPWKLIFMVFLASSWVRLSVHLHCMLLTWRCSRRILWAVVRWSPFHGTTDPTYTPLHWVSYSWSRSSLKGSSSAECS